ncbi:hypothetical protein BDQ17DRAFT_1365433 [Cyathus striatus]|nr:hypothetical protein BDQ17DRAFT_1365433 [Cyathus striatus]
MGIGGEWQINVYGQALRVSIDMLHAFEPYDIKDVLLNSLAPLTHQYSRSEAGRIQKQAAAFFSAFEPHAMWNINVDNLPEEIGSILMGVTENSRNLNIGFRFMRFRFPHLWFEVSPLSLPEWMPGGHSNIKITSLWKAWARDGHSSGIAAYGITKDNIRMSQRSDGKPLFKIVFRTFEVVQVLQPEPLTPVPYPANIPPLTTPSSCPAAAMVQ